MLKINQIQNALKEIEQGKFQKLADRYIYRKRGYENINSLGSVIGANKTKSGTPDAFVRQEDGKLVFAEHTTKQKDLLKKLIGDIHQCLDVSKTGVPIKDIDEIIFCHNSKLSLEQDQKLHKVARENGIKDIRVYDIDTISLDLLDKYPGLAKEYLGISIDTGQILETDEFVEIYGKNKLTTPLDTEFYFRENEVNQTIEILDSSSILIIYGSSGVGKTRLALHAIQEFEKINKDYQIRCIYNRGLDLFEDLKTFFLESGKYLILVDDGNRIGQLNQIIEMIQNKREDQEFKIVITVRDYAKDDILKTTKPVLETKELELKTIEDSQIQELVEKLYGIKNRKYLERISDIAKGNPRLAIMAAKVAVENNTLQSIYDVTALYDEYFHSMRDDLNSLQNDDVLKASGIISFFGSIDHTNDEMMNTINKVFNITPKDFWDAAQYLYKCEAVDIYENEVVKISDQVLNIYLFYVCYIKDKIIDISTLIDKYFPQKSDRLIESIYPCIDTFYSDSLMDQIRDPLKRKWKELYEAGNSIDLYKLIKDFWFVLPTQSLNYIKEEIESMEVNTCCIPDIDWTIKSRYVDPQNILSLLGNFIRSGKSNFQIALDLVYKYIEKRPSEAPILLMLLTERFGFTRDSFSQEYNMQLNVINQLWEKTSSGKNELYTKIFLEASKYYLDTYIMNSVSVGQAYNIYKFDLGPHKNLYKLRDIIWEGIFTLYDAKYEKDALDVIKYYIGSSNHSSQNEIIVEDTEHLISFFEHKLRPDNFTNCLIVQSYLSFLERRRVPYDITISEKFSNSTYLTYKLILFDYSDRDDMNFQEYNELKKEQIKAHTREFDLSDYNELIDQCQEIRSQIIDGHQIYLFETGLLQALLVLSERDSGLYKQVIQEYLKLGDPCIIQQPTILIEKLIQFYGAEKTLSIIEGADFPTKDTWRSSYYQKLPSDPDKPLDIKSLYKLYREAKPEELPMNCDYLIKYLDQDSEVIINITKIILDRVSTEPEVTRALEMMFNPHTKLNKQIIDLFVGNQNLLEDAYIKILSDGLLSLDYDGVMLGRLLLVNPYFIDAIIDSFYTNNYVSPQSGNKYDYSFLWKHEYCENIVTRAINRIIENEELGKYSIGSDINELFCINYNNTIPSEIVEKQDEYLTNLIKTKCNDMQLMTLIFVPISYFHEDRMRRFIKLFLDNNKTYVDFECLTIEPCDTGPWVSVVQELKIRIDFLESLLPLCNSTDLLKHKNYIEDRIEGLKSRLKSKKKSHFMDDN